MEKIVIGFTGHRNNPAYDINELQKLLHRFPIKKYCHLWVHGGAIGFDSQVEKFAKENSIDTVVIRPDYKNFGKAAPLIRNKKIVDQSNIIVACYDGRKKGGTFYTINYAKGKEKQVVFVKTKVGECEKIHL